MFTTNNRRSINKSYKHKDINTKTQTQRVKHKDSNTKTQIQRLKHKGTIDVQKKVQDNEKSALLTLHLPSYNRFYR